MSSSLLNAARYVAGEDLVGENGWRMNSAIAALAMTVELQCERI